MLNKTNAGLAWRKKEPREATAKVMEIEKMAKDWVADAKWEAKGQIAKAHRSIVESFWASMDFAQEKAQVVESFKASEEFHDTKIMFS